MYTYDKKWDGDSWLFTIFKDGKAVKGGDIEFVQESVADEAIQKIIKAMEEFDVRSQG